MKHPRIEGGFKMNKTTLAILSAIVLSLFIIPSNASAWGLEAGVGYWMQTPSGTMGYKGDSLSIKNEFNFDTEYQPYARIKAELPLFFPNLYLVATPMEFKGDGNKNFTFGDITINGAFASKLTLHHYDLAFYYSLPFLKTATLDKLNVELGINARVIDFEARVTELTTNETTSKSLTIPVPMVYIGLQFAPIKAFSIEAEARGIMYGSNHYYDLIGRVKVKPISSVFIAAGYRHETIKISQSDVEAKINFGGPFAEVGVVF
jgi:outer membrane protein